MGVTGGVDMITDGLVFYVDAANPNSYISGNTTTNDLIQSNNGTLINGVGFSTENNGAWDFDGTDDYINCGNPSILNFGDGSSDNPFSIFSWINMTTANDFVVMSKWTAGSGQWAIRFYLNKFRAYFLDNTNSGWYIGRMCNSLTASDYQNQWINFGFTYNGNSTSAGIKLYLNGVQIDDANYQGGSYVAMEATSQPAQIGAQGSYIDSSHGYISNINIYNRALSSTEILQNYNALKGRFGL